MTPPKKKPKLEELVIVDVSIRPPPSKPTQIVSCSQSSQSRVAIPTFNMNGVETVNVHKIIRRALEKEKEKKGD